MAVDILTPRDVQTTLNYYVPLDDRTPYNYKYPPPGEQKTNVGRDTRPMIIYDARGKDAEFSLDRSGFQFVNYPSAVKDFGDDEEVKRVYYPEVEALLRKYTDAKKIIIFNHKVRRPSGIDPKASGPLQQVHSDQTPAAAAERVRENFGDDSERFLKGRYRIINIWRPIINPAAHTPLTVADYRTITHDRDLVATRQIDPHREGSTYNIKYSPEHKWYYYSDQTPDEVVIFKTFDTDVDKARLAPHTAFHDSTSPADAPQRQSIEVRALLLDTE